MNCVNMYSQTSFYCNSCLYYKYTVDEMLPHGTRNGIEYLASTREQY